MLLIVGLGNPGLEYEFTRHNIGFMFADRLAEAHGIPFDNKNPQAVWGSGLIDGTEVFVLKPQTYMNLSGEAVREFYTRLPLEPSSVIAAYDDVDLPLGRLRLRKGGGSGGHRGVESIIACLGETSFPRLRLGVGRPADDTTEVRDYVLSAFDESELTTLDDVLTRAVQALESFIRDGIDKTMNRFNPA